MQRKWSVIAFLLVVLSTSPVSSGAPVNYITLASGEWAPFVSEQEMLEPAGLGSGRGIAVEIVEHVLGNMHYHPHMVFLPWGDIEPSLHKGQIRLSFPWYDSEERRSKLLFSSPLTQSTTVIYYNHEQIRRAEDFKRYGDLGQCRPPCRLGLVEGYAYPEGVERFREYADISPDVEAAFEKLIGGKIALLPVDQEVAFHLLKNRFPQRRHRVAILPEMEQASRDLYLVGAKTEENEAFLKNFDAKLKEFQGSHLYHRVRSRYQPKELGVPEVRLTAGGSYPLVFGTKREHDSIDDVVLLPQGSRAWVLQWHPSFHQPGKLNLQEQMSQKSLVKIMRGPQRDRVLWVPNIFITIE